MRIKSKKLKTDLLQYCDEFDAIKKLRILDKSRNIKNVIVRNYYDILNIRLRKPYQYIIKPSLYKRNVHLLDFIVVPIDNNKPVSFELFFEGVKDDIKEDHTIILQPFPVKIKNLSKEQNELVKKLCCFHISYTAYNTEAFLYGNLYGFDTLTDRV